MIPVTEHSSLEDILEFAFMELRRAVVDKRHPFRYFAFATVRPGAVGIRTVVLRKIRNGVIYIHTDKRSQKVAELMKSDQCSALFYHDKIKVQIKVEGHAEVHFGGEAYEKEWSELSPMARKAYRFIHPPGETIENPQEGHSTGDCNEFCLVKMNLEQLEVLQLNKMEHIRARFMKSKGQWKGKFIAP